MLDYSSKGGLRVALVRVAIPKSSVMKKENWQMLDACQGILGTTMDEHGISVRHGKHHSPFGETESPLRVSASGLRVGYMKRER